MSNVLKHLKKIMTHKWWVFYYCCKCGLVWQGITHDLSKFSPIEFFESVKYYQGTSSPIDACKLDKGYSMAWQHHKGRNPHHYEYWTDGYDKEICTCIKMPWKYATEMFCDYVAAGRAYMGKDFNWDAECAWWEMKKWKVRMHHSTMAYIDNLFYMGKVCNRFPDGSLIRETRRHY